MAGPIIWPEYRWFMGALLSVEINTWFLILRRVLFKSRDRLHPIVTEFVSYSFYISWIAIRCFVYPAILYDFLRRAEIKITESGRFFHWELLFFPMQITLCILNLKWTYDLFKPIVLRWVSKDAAGPTVASGL